MATLDGDYNFASTFSFTSFLAFLFLYFFFFFKSNCLVLSPKLWNFELVEVCNMDCCLENIFSCISPLWTAHLCIEQLLSSYIGETLSLYSTVWIVCILYFVNEFLPFFDRLWAWFCCENNSYMAVTIWICWEKHAWKDWVHLAMK